MSLLDSTFLHSLRDSIPWQGLLWYVAVPLCASVAGAIIGAGIPGLFFHRFSKPNNSDRHQHIREMYIVECGLGIGVLAAHGLCWYYLGFLSILTNIGLIAAGCAYMRYRLYH